MILLSDGRDTGSQVAPEAAAQRAADLDVPVFTVVLGESGTQGGANADLLEQVASTTGASTFKAATGAELQSVYQALGEQLSSDLAIGGTGPLFIVLGARYSPSPPDCSCCFPGRTEY